MKNLIEWFKSPPVWEMDPNYKLQKVEIPPVDLTDHNMTWDRRLEILDNFMNWEPMLGISILGKRITITLPPNVVWFCTGFWGIVGYMIVQYLKV